MTAIFWFRRDLRLEDNTALQQALRENRQVIPVFIFDTHILEELPRNDARLTFIYQRLEQLHRQLLQAGSGLVVQQGEPLKVWQNLLRDYQPNAVYFNADYEPYARQRDQQVEQWLQDHAVACHRCKDQVIFDAREVLKADGTNYTVFTPYKNKWLQHFGTIKPAEPQRTELQNLARIKPEFPKLAAIGFEPSAIKVRDYDLTKLDDYESARDIPHLDAGSYLGVHLRFGTVSIRDIVRKVYRHSPTFLNELIWREFFMQTLYHTPRVVHENFKTKYNGIQWRNNEDEFERWCRGETGFPMVDAGMRQLNQTGYMHNRVRMITAGFLCKHLLTDWRRGEAYFAEKLLDYELASNNGNWQWAAGTGCDAAPYFRVFNPLAQQKKFDPNMLYVQQWIPELNTSDYPPPMVDHKQARIRAIDTYKKGLVNR